MTIEWLTEGVTLPRYVVWGTLLTSPALWSSQFKAMVKERIPISGPKRREEGALSENRKRRGNTQAGGHDTE